MRRFSVSLLALSLAWLVPTTGAHAQQPTEGPLLKKLSVPAAQVKPIATTLGLRYRKLPEVTISPDQQNQQLLVLAPAGVQEKIAGEVQQLLAARQQQGLRASSEPVRVQLAGITWREFEQRLQEVAGARLPVTTSRDGQRASFQLNRAALADTTVEVDRQNNVVTVMTSEPKRDGWQKLIRTLDQSPARRGEIMKVVRLNQAEPAPVQRAIRLLRDLEPAPEPAMAASTPQITRSPLQTAVFQAPANQNAAGDNRADAVIVPDGQAEPEPNGDEAAADEEAGAGVIGDTEIQFVPELGVIIIKGAQRDVARVREVIEEIERQSEITRPAVQVRQLKHANSNAVAELLQQLYEDVLSARQGEVNITALDAPNALLLIGREEAIAGVLELIQKIDQPIKEDDRLRVFRLMHASAIDAEETVRNFFTTQPGVDEEPRPGLGVRVRILADYRTNSLIVSASPRDMQEVTRLINQLDVREIPAESEIKIFPLHNAVAENMVETLRAAITGEDEGELPENVTRPSTSLSIVSLNAEGNRVLDSGVLSGAVFTADQSGNAIVVRASSPSMPLIAELIRQLDQAPNIESLVKVFTIENGDAAQLTTALQELFGEEAASEGTSVGAGNIAALAGATASESSLVPLRFSTDVRTNSIIASGSAQDLDVVESILLRLDSEGFAERITEVIWLKHQVAENVAAAIQQYVQQRVQTVNTIQQYQQGLGPFDLPDRDLIVVAEPQSNSLLLSVAPRLYEDVRRLIDNLDRRPPMVMIKVVLAEVELSDSFEIGGEIGLQDSLLFNRGVAAASLGPTQGTDGGAVPTTLPPSDPGFNFNNANLPNANSFGQESLAGRAISTFGVGTSSAAEGVGGFVLSAASESVSLLFRTLQAANRLQIISRPQVMTMDNIEALIQVGQQVARPSSVNVTQNTTTVGVTEEDVGLILRVKPRVGADGLIVMDIDATRSGVNNTAPGQTIGFFNEGQPVTVQPIDKTTAQSTITAYSGQTVIFGGLIQKRRENISRRVPYLADIPLLGYMFKFDREVERRSELLVVMTPMLITGEEDLQYVKEVESSRMSWCLADVVEAHGDVGLSGGYGLWGPAVGPTIYPDLQPTVDHVIVQDRPLPGGQPAPHGHQAAPHGPEGMPYQPGQVLPGGETVLEANPPMIESRPEAMEPGYPTPALPPPQPPAPREYQPESYRPGPGPGSQRPQQPGSPGVDPTYSPGRDRPPSGAPRRAFPSERATPGRSPQPVPSSSDRPATRQGFLNGPRGESRVSAASGQQPGRGTTVRQSFYSGSPSASGQPGRPTPAAVPSWVRTASGSAPAPSGRPWRAGHGPANSEASQTGSHGGRQAQQVPPRSQPARRLGMGSAAAPSAAPTSPAGDAPPSDRSSRPSVSPQSWIR